MAVAVLTSVFSVARPVPVAAATGLEQAVAATVMLRTADGRDRFLGSGVIYGSAREILTNAHVVGDAGAVRVVSGDGSRATATVVRVDRGRDLALLWLDRPLGAAIAVGEIPALAQQVWAIGAPLEAAQTVTAGIVSGLDRQIDPAQPVGYLQHSAPVNPGSSGGALVDARGRLIGINARIADGSRFFVGIAYAVPLPAIADFMAGLPSGPAVVPGFALRPLDENIGAILGLGAQSGALVDDVALGAPADLAGLRAGDVLLRVGNHEITGPGDVAFALASNARTIRLGVWRAGRVHQLTIRLTKAPQALAGSSRSPLTPKQSYSLTEMGIHVEPSGLITRLGQNRVGFFAGLSQGDRILALNGIAVADMEADWPVAYTISGPMLALIRLPDGSTRHYVIDPWDTGKGLRPVSGANVVDQEVVRFD